MGITYNGKAYTDVSQITGPSGWYNLKIDGRNVPVYVDQEYDGGGWVLVLANRKDTGGMRNLNYYNAINTCNYRTGDTLNTNTISGPKGISSLTDFNVWIGTKYWEALSKRQTTGKVTVVQFVAPTIVSLSDATHTKRSRWQFDSFDGFYAMTNKVYIANEVGTSTPGFYSYNAGYKLSAFDSDNDAYGGNCSLRYGNNPWWYGSCWSGNYFAGGGYQDAPYWASTDFHNYGAVYIK